MKQLSFPGLPLLRRFSRFSRRTKRLVLANTVAGLLVSLAFPSLATTNIFTGGTSTWNLLSNWSLAHVPSSTDALFFNSSTTANNTLDNDYTAQTLSFDTGSANFNIDANSSGTTTHTLTLTGGTNANGGTDLISLSANTTGTINVGSTAGVGTLTVAFGSTTGTINVANAAATLVFGSSSTITGSNGLTKNGAGTLTLAGTNSYSGTTTINAGTVIASKLANTGTASSIGTGTTLKLNGGTLQYIGAGDSTDRNINFGNNGGTLDASGTGTITFGGTITAIGASSRTLTLTGTGYGYLGGIPNAVGGPTTLIKNGTGTWELGGSNSYTGTTTINAGTLIFDSSFGSTTNAAGLILGDGVTLGIGSGAADHLFTLNGSATILGQVPGVNFTNTGAIALSGTNTPRTLTFSGITNIYFAPALGDNGTGATSVTTTGGVTLIFTGPKSYSGDTTVNSGLLLSVVGTNFLSPNSHVNLLAGAELELNGFNNAVNGISVTGGQVAGLDIAKVVGPGVLSSSGTINLAEASISADLSGTGGLVKTTTAYALITGTCTYTGGTEIDAGQLEVAGDFRANGTVNIFAGAILSLDGGNMTQGIDFGTLTGGGTLDKGASTMIINRANPFTGTIAVNAGQLVVSGSLNGTAVVTVGGGTNPATLSGNGTIALASGGAIAVRSGATLAPDSGTGSGLTINAVSGTASLNLQSGSTLQLAITNSLAGSQGAPSLNDYSKLTLGTNVTATLSGLIATTVTGTVNNGDVYIIVFSSSAVNGMFSNTSTAAANSAGSTYVFTSGGQEWEINYAWTGSTPLAGEDFGTFAQVTGGTNVALLAIPEPSSLPTFLTGSTLLLGCRRRRRMR